jgi:ADP-ribose pyrophosphatase YjhB (NUDIX family)
MLKRPFSSKQFKAIYSQVPRLTVEVVVKTPEGILLTLRRLPSWHNQWHLPGGTVYYEETLKEAVKRIAREEIGVTVTVGRLLGYIEYTSETKERGFGWSVGLAFACTIQSGTLRGSIQAEEIQFFKTLPANTVAETKVFLEKTVLRL